MNAQLTGRNMVIIFVLAVGALIAIYAGNQFSTQDLPVIAGGSQVTDSIAGEPVAASSATVSGVENERLSREALGHLGSAIKPDDWYTPQVSRLAVGGADASPEFESVAGDNKTMIRALMANSGAGPALIDWDALREASPSRSEIDAAYITVGHLGSAVKPADWYEPHVRALGVDGASNAHQFEDLVGDNADLLNALTANPGAGPALIDWEALKVEGDR